MGRAVSLGLVSLVTWLLWSGHYTPLLLALGAASCLVVLLIARRMGLLDEEGWVPLYLAPRLLVYLPWLIRAIVRANLHVALRILRPGPPIAPRLLRVRPGQRTSLGRAIYANSITLTPGTLTCDADGDEFTVHALTREAADDLESGLMDRQVRDLEGRKD